MRWIPVQLAWLLAAALMTQAAADDSCELKVGWEPYAPYTFSGDDGQATGIDIDLIRAAGEEVGCTTEFQEMPWARILREVEQGTLDVATSASRNEDRSTWGLFSTPYRKSENAIYVRVGEESKFQLDSLTDVPKRELRLGVIVDYYYGPEIEEVAKDPEFAAWMDGAPDYATNIRKLLNGRVDGILAEDVGVMQAELRRLGAKDAITRHPLYIPGEELHFLFSQQTVDPAIVAKIDQSVSQMRADGRFDAILAKYF
ncbi:MAG: transporter substrate-binding domain-containing protein [Pseudomonadota bacterium]